MKLIRYGFILFIIHLLISCQEKSEIRIPVIEVYDTDNIFTFTNKNAGTYVGQTHSKNPIKNGGWFVDGYHYLRDYQIIANGQILSRDSIQIFRYFPHQLIREYKKNVTETFTLIDSLNALVWEISSKNPNMEFAIKPVFPDSTLNTHILNKNTQFQIISTIKHIPDSINLVPHKMGFHWQQASASKAEVFCVLGKDEDTITQNILSLTASYHNKINDRKQDILDFLAINDVVTNLPEISEAVQWAQISLDALIYLQPNSDILAGLPNSNTYLGRNTFISLTGALLVTGKFSQARQILSYYAKFQLTNPDDSWTGRIANRITDDEIKYNTADVTWWFIREVYEYILYSGDVAFAREIFPVVKIAIQGALRYRIDEYFFLCHNENETWMNQARGNRAVEIQVLWYTALQIASKLAALTSEQTLSEYWHVISQTLRRNFIVHFWNDFNFRMNDHIKPGGKVSKKIRPNQIFSVTVPDLAGIEPLIGLEEQANITSQVTKKLTFRQGVSTLWQKDPDFYATRDNFKTIQHNGMISSWLSGPIITALTNMRYNDLAFELFFNESIQILEQDAIGTLSEYIDAPLHSDQSKAEFFGSVSSTRGLGEYARNFYQNMIGFRPNALVNVAEFKPVLTEDFTYMHAKLYMSDHIIIYDANESEDIIICNIHSPDLSDTLNIIINYPGFDKLYEELTPANPEIQIKYDLAWQRQYKNYNHLDWYFAQPEEIRD